MVPASSDTMRTVTRIGNGEVFRSWRLAPDSLDSPVNLVQRAYWQRQDGAICGDHQGHRGYSIRTEAGFVVLTLSNHIIVSPGKSR